jgi:hypothetical protein
MKTIPALVFAFITMFMSVSSCQQVKERSKVYIKPFEMTLWDSDFSLGYSFQYLLSEKTLIVQYQGEIEGERDSTVYEKAVDQDPLLRSISEIDFQSLQDHYVNECVKDGSQIRVIFKMDTTITQVILSNYYQADIGSVVRYINNNTPKEYHIYYDSVQLTRDYNECK